MGIRMVRQPSETPNITNIDDIIPFRYAYGNQNGYVIGKGTGISHTIQGNTFRVNSGRVVLQGVETDIDANGVSFIIDNSNETRYFVVYYEVNLATQTTAIKLSDYSINGYPSIDTGDDLTVNSSGIARTELYRFTANTGVISNVEKIITPLQYMETKVNNIIHSKFVTDEVSRFNNKIIPKIKNLYDNPKGFNISGLSSKQIFTNISSLVDKYLLVEHGNYGHRYFDCIKVTDDMSSTGCKIYNDVDDRNLVSSELFSYHNAYLWLSDTKTISGTSYYDIILVTGAGKTQQVADYYIYSVYELII